MSEVSSIPSAGIDPPPPAPPPTFQFTLTKSRRRNVKKKPNTIPVPAPPFMEGCGLGLINNNVLPGRERVPPKIFDPSSPQPTKRRRGRPPTKRLPNASCMSPEAAGGDSQMQVEPCAISPVPASPLSPPSNQSNDNQPIHHVRDHLGLQSPASVGVPSIHQPIGSTTYMKVENIALNDDEYRREDVIRGASMEPHQGVNENFSNGVADALTVESQPTENTRVSNVYNLATPTCYTNIVLPTEESQLATSNGDSDIYDVNRGFKGLLQSIVESQPATSTMDSSIYNVNSSYADTLKSIFEKHGDIVKDCTLQSPYLRTSFLEAICKDVQELQAKKLTELDYDLLNSYYLVTNDGETMKFNVKWFRKRLDEIRTAMDSLVESQKMAEKMKQLEDKKRDLQLKKTELEKLISDVEGMERQLALETLQVVEEMNKSSRDLEFKFKQFQDMHLMDGVL